MRRNFKVKYGRWVGLNKLLFNPINFKGLLKEKDRETPLKRMKGEIKKMKVKELIKQLQQTGEKNEVRIISDLEGFGTENTDKLYLSFDDVGDVLIYESEED